MKKLARVGAVAFTVSILLSSCYSYTTVVGEGAQGNQEVTEWNHYAVFGIARLGTADVKKMAGDAENYTIHTRHTLKNGVIHALTFGLYAPTTTTVTK